MPPYPVTKNLNATPYPNETCHTNPSKYQHGSLCQKSKCRPKRQMPPYPVKSSKYHPRAYNAHHPIYSEQKYQDDTHYPESRCSPILSKKPNATPYLKLKCHPAPQIDNYPLHPAQESKCHACPKSKCHAILSKYQHGNPSPKSKYRPNPPRDHNAKITPQNTALTRPGKHAPLHNIAKRLHVHSKTGCSYPYMIIRGLSKREEITLTRASIYPQTPAQHMQHLPSHTIALTRRHTNTLIHNTKQRQTNKQKPYFGERN